MGQGLPIIEDSRSHSDTPHSAGLLWTSDQPDAETSTWQHTTLTTDKHPCLRVGFEPTIPAGERSKTNALDHAATGTGNWKVTGPHYVKIVTVLIYVLGWCYWRMDFFWALNLWHMPTYFSQRRTVYGCCCSMFMRVDICCGSAERLKLVASVETYPLITAHFTVFVYDYGLMTIINLWLSWGQYKQLSDEIRY